MEFNVNEAVLKYRECARNIWNAYLRAAANWDTADNFREIQSALFRGFVLRPLGQDGNVPPSEPYTFLLVEVAEPTVPIMVARPSSDGNAYWDAEPRAIQPGEATLYFIDFFDWYDLGVRDFAYVRVRVANWRGHPEVAGRDALLELRHSRVVAPAALK